MSRWSFLRCPPVAWQFQTPILFQAVKQGLMLGSEAAKCTYLNELNVRKPLVVFISPRSEKRRLYNLLVQNSTISSPILKAVSPNASAGWTVFGVWPWSGFSEWGIQDLSNGPNVRLLTRQRVSVFVTSIVYGLSHVREGVIGPRLRGICLQTSCRAWTCIICCWFTSSLPWSRVWTAKNQSFEWSDHGVDHN